MMTNRLSAVFFFCIYSNSVFYLRLNFSSKLINLESSVGGINEMKDESESTNGEICIFIDFSSLVLHPLFNIQFIFFLFANCLVLRECSD